MGFAILWLLLIIICYYSCRWFAIRLAIGQMAAIALSALVFAEGLTIFLLFNVDAYNYFLPDIDSFAWVIQYFVPALILIVLKCSLLTYFARRKYDREALMNVLLIITLFSTFALIHGSVLMRELDQFRTVSPATYIAEEASDGEITTEWRYGYIQGIHSAEMVKTPNDPLAFALRPTEINQRASELVIITKKHQDRVPLLAFGEALLYLCLTLILYFFMHLIRTYPRMRLIFLLLGIGLCITIALLPLALFNYGASLYSTYAGPGALAASGAYYRLTWVSADTVSYRIFLERLLLPSSQIFALIGLDRLIAQLTDSHVSFLGIESLLFWLIITTIIAIAPAAKRRIYPQIEKP